MNERRVELGVEDALTEVDGLNATMLVQLGEADVKTVDDLAELTPEELRFILLEGAPKLPVEEFNHVKDERREKLLAKRRSRKASSPSRWTCCPICARPVPKTWSSTRRSTRKKRRP